MRFTRVSAAAVLLAAGAALPGPAPVTAQSVEGEWSVRWAQGIRTNRDGSIEIQRWGDAELILEQDGTTVTGTWTTHVLERVTWQVTGSLSGTRLTLEATENDSEDPELDIVDKLVWESEVSADRIEGAIVMWFRGMNRVPGERPFTATPAGNN